MTRPCVSPGLTGVIACGPVSGALARTGVEATPVDAFDLGFLSDSNHGHARPLSGIGDSIRTTLERVPGIPVVTGFLAKDRAGNLTTLGRNGSDLTASVLAEALAASEVQFWKPVAGILTADPELVPTARRIPSLTYMEAAECAFHGSRVLHPACVAPALRAGLAAFGRVELTREEHVEAGRTSGATWGASVPKDTIVDR